MNANGFWQQPNRWCRIDFVSHTADEDRHGLNNARALACEVVAIDCVGYLSEHDVVQYLGFEIPEKIEESLRRTSTASETTNLLAEQNISRNNNNSNRNNNLRHGGNSSASASGLTTPNALEDGEEDDADAKIVAAYGGLNALEIAIVAEAKYFLSQKSVQRVVDGM